MDVLGRVNIKVIRRNTNFKRAPTFTLPRSREVRHTILTVRRDSSSMLYHMPVQLTLVLEVVESSVDHQSSVNTNIQDLCKIRDSAKSNIGCIFDFFDIGNLLFEEAGRASGLWCDDYWGLVEGVADDDFLGFEDVAAALVGEYEGNECLGG
ncbi:hypothetical protein CC78DRAFT_619940 [Lojkania enalia]|uniref:Uncharacterized protein n=1 Tax=Lojkania enalia TaxID=147567 RepID=A0A9P4N6P1_9PLEO|nr:hypothetical protein CC78DRAFT_619940 [Didymosphaeria enalia]